MLTFFNLFAQLWNKLQLVSPSWSRFRFQPDLKPSYRRWKFAIELAIKVKSEILKDVLKMLILIRGGSRKVERRVGKIED